MEDVIDFIEEMDKSTEGATKQRLGVVLVNPMHAGVFETEEDITGFVGELSSKYKDRMAFVRMLEIRKPTTAQEEEAWNAMCKPELRSTHTSLIHDILST